MAEAPPCFIAAEDPRLQGQQVAFSLANMKCKLNISNSQAGRPQTFARSSMIGTVDVEATRQVVAALVVTGEKLMLDLLRVGKDDAPKEYLCVGYQDNLFLELGLEFSNDKKSCHLVFNLPDAGRFLKAAELNIPEQSTIRIVLETYQAPDVAAYVNKVLLSMGVGVAGDDCVIKEGDARLEGQQVAFCLNNMKCRMQITAGGHAGNGGKRCSVYSTPEAGGTRQAYAAIAVTDEKFIMDLKRVGKDDVPNEYFCCPYSAVLCKDIGLQHSNDAVNSHLQITLPDASRFFGASKGDLDVPQGTTIQVMLDTWMAPDICMFVKHKVNMFALSRDSDCQISLEDARLAGKQVVFHLNSMKCRLQTLDAAVQLTRSSILESPESAAKRMVFAALVCTEDMLVLDMKRVGKDPDPKEVLSIPYEDARCAQMGLEFSNDSANSHLHIVLPDAATFLNLSNVDFEVPPNGTITFVMDTWKAPDIAMFVKQKINKAARAAAAAGS